MLCGIALVVPGFWIFVLDVEMDADVDAVELPMEVIITTGLFLDDAMVESLLDVVIFDPAGHNAKEMLVYDGDRVGRLLPLKEEVAVA